MARFSRLLIGAALAAGALASPAGARPGAEGRLLVASAVGACTGQAQRIGRGLIRIEAARLIGSDRVRVVGTVDGYDRYGYERYGRIFAASLGENRFTCVAAPNGRIEDFHFGGS
jgi:predicted N-acetyltransferase YhbS